MTQSKFPLFIRYILRTNVHMFPQSNQLLYYTKYIECSNHIILYKRQHVVNLMQYGSLPKMCSFFFISEERSKENRKGIDQAKIQPGGMTQATT